MTTTDTATQPTEQPTEVARVERPLHPTSPRELLLTTYHASSLHGAEQILATFQEYDFELARKQPLDAEQRARADALRIARSVVEGRTPISTNALTPVQTSELVPLARFILTGSEFEQDVRIEVAQERAAREAAEQAQDPEDGCPGGC